MLRKNNRLKAKQFQNEQSIHKFCRIIFPSSFLFKLDKKYENFGKGSNLGHTVLQVVWYQKYKKKYKLSLTKLTKRLGTSYKPLENLKNCFIPIFLEMKKSAFSKYFIFPGNPAETRRQQKWKKYFFVREKIKFWLRERRGISFYRDFPRELLLFSAREKK